VQENRAGLGTEVRRDEPGATWREWQNYPELVALLAEVQSGATAPGLAFAPMGRRMAAFALDLFLVAIPTMIICITLALALIPDVYVQLTVWSALHPFSPPELPPHLNLIVDLISDTLLVSYFTGFWIAHGQTPAKALLRLRVVDEFGKKPSLVKSLVRALVLVFSMGLLFLPFTYAFFNPQRRAMHDFFAGTYVVEA
jgi:uncharacterized RDD family membrane protein YckC